MTESHKGWIGVDLDGTLAHYDCWVAPDVIGDPVPLMLERVKSWRRRGIDVRIFTARVAFDETVNGFEISEIARTAIQRWCHKHLGEELRITCVKDLSMVELWDDRCVQIVANTGKRADGHD